MAKKKNPHITLKQSDVRRIKEEVTRSATEHAFILFFTVMHDKWGFGRRRIARIFRQVEELASMVNDTPRTVTMEQLEKSLVEELGVRLK